MEKKLSKRKLLRRKYKRYVAALAGAAILTGAGAAIPATTFASANPANNSSHYDTRYDTRNNDKSTFDTRFDGRDNNAGYVTRYNNGTRFDTRFDYRSGWHRHNHSWPSSDDNQALYKDGHIYYSNR